VEEGVHATREALQKAYEAKMAEVQNICQRLSEDFLAKVETERTHNGELQGTAKWLRDRADFIEHRLRIVDEEFVECRKKYDGINTTELMKEAAGLRDAVSDAQNREDTAIQDAKLYKGKLIRAYKEIAKLKREKSAQIQLQIEKDRRELAVLRSKYADPRPTQTLHTPIYDNR